MSQKIIKPEGMELIEYLNDGYAICNKCGAVMDRREDPNGGCGWEVDEMEYEYEDDEEVEWASSVHKSYGGDIPPAGCRACGGPYPHCKTSCKLFDN